MRHQAPRQNAAPTGGTPRSSPQRSEGLRQAVARLGPFASSARTRLASGGRYGQTHALPRHHPHHEAQHTGRVRTAVDQVSRKIARHAPQMGRIDGATVFIHGYS